MLVRRSLKRSEIFFFFSMTNACKKKICSFHLLIWKKWPFSFCETNKSSAKIEMLLVIKWRFHTLSRNLRWHWVDFFFFCKLIECEQILITITNACYKYFELVFNWKCKQWQTYFWSCELCYFVERLKRNNWILK